MSEIYLDNGWQNHVNSDRPTFPCFSEQAIAQWECDDATYIRRTFWYALPRHVLPLAGLVWLLRRDFFARDLELIGELGRTREAHEFYYLIEQFRDETFRQGGWLRRRLRLRVSGTRLRRLRWVLR